MKKLTEYLITEKIADKKDINLNLPVMFSIYGNVNGPWYFGYKVDDKEGGVVSSLEDRNISYPKLIVDFDEFDPINLKNNN